MSRHKYVQSTRRLLTYSQVHNATDILYGSLRCPSKTDTGPFCESFHDRTPLWHNDRTPLWHNGIRIRNLWTERRRSDPVLWQKPLHQQKCQKGKVTTQTTPQKKSIKQQFKRKRKRYDRRSNFFSPPARLHVCTVTYITEISLSWVELVV